MKNREKAINCFLLLLLTIKCIKLDMYQYQILISLLHEGSLIKKKEIKKRTLKTNKCIKISRKF